MRLVHPANLALAVLVFSQAASPQDSLDLVKRVSENYKALHSFEIAGHLDAIVPGTEFHLRIPTVNARADHTFAPANGSVTQYRESVQFFRPKFTDPQSGKPVLDPKISLTTPSHWAYFDKLPTDIKSARRVSTEVLTVGGQPFQSVVVEVVLERKRWDPEEQAIRLWIDPTSLFVMKEEFSERQRLRHDTGLLWKWTYTVESIKLNQPPPDWLVDMHQPRPNDNKPKPEWVGRAAEEFSLSDVNGHQVRLSDFHGKVVVLDFWATWCGPCREEMPVVAKLRADFAPQGVEVWGISDEDSATLKEFATKNENRVPTLMDPDGQIADQYKVEGIPDLVVIGRDGKVVSYFYGMQPEPSLREAIELALKQGAAKPE